MAVVQRMTRAGVVLASAALLSSCMLASDFTTLNPYAPSDGIRIEVADGVNVENLLVLAPAEGETAHVVGTIVNNSSELVTVLIDVGETGNPSPFDVPGNGNIALHEANVTIESVDAAPGATIGTHVQGPDGYSVVRQTPVLDGTLPEYAEFLEQASSPESATS